MAATPKYEYLPMPIYEGDDVVQSLWAAGQNGWKLVSFIPDRKLFPPQPGPRTPVTWALLVRPLPST